MKSGQLSRSQTFCALHTVCWHAVLLEDESGQQAIAVFDEIWKNDNLVITYKQNKLLFIKTSQ